MGIEERKERERLERRKAILAAAEELFREKGYEATMDEIAAHAELSKPTLYLYFENKDDLYASIALEGFEALKDTFRQVSDSGADVQQKVRSMYRAFIEFTTRHRQVSRITEFVLSERGRNKVSGELSERISRDISDLLGFGAGVIQEGIDGGVFADGLDPLVVSVIVWRASVGLVDLAIEEGLPGWEPAYYDRLFESALVLLSEGIRKR